MTLRLEIIGNRSIQEDLFDLFAKYKTAALFTLIPEVQGTGQAGPRQGDAVWPEENFIAIVYCDKQEANTIRKAIEEIRERFPDEGLAVFAAKAESF